MMVMVFSTRLRNRQMKKIISFSLYVTPHSEPKPVEYLVGAVRNAELAAQI